MIGLFLLTWYVGIPALLGILPLFLPSRFAWAGFATTVLLAGLAFLEDHTIPFQDHGNGFSEALGLVFVYTWLVFATLGFAIRVVATNQQDEDDFAPMPIWPFPIGLLMAVLFFHWIANRLAGAHPAWLIHLAVGVPVAGAAIWLFRIGKRSMDILEAGRLLALAAFTSLALLVVKAAVMAPIWAQRAEDEAAGAPYCLLTFGGRDHPRTARSVFDLSPLVSRSGARSFIDDAAWLVVERGGKMQTLRWRNGAFSEQKRPSSCAPRRNGEPSER